jgi:hypothetical protein
MVISDGIPVVPRNRKSQNSVPNPCAKEKTTRNYVPWNKNRSKLHNSVPNPSAEENTARNSVPWDQNICKFSEFRSELFRGRDYILAFLSVQQKIEIYSRNAVPNRSVEEKPTQNKTRQPNISILVSEKTTFDVKTNHFVKLLCCCFVKLIFPRNSIPFRGIGSSAPRNSECLGIIVFFRGITETVPSLFRGIFSKQNSVCSPNSTHIVRTI